MTLGSDQGAIALSLDGGPRWRIGRHYAIHVYEDERPVATFHAVLDAQRCVQAVNGNAATTLRGLLERWVALSAEDMEADYPVNEPTEKYRALYHESRAALAAPLDSVYKFRYTIGNDAGG